MSFNEGDAATSKHQQTLEQVQSAKYLGLTITDDLDWGQHISEITCKATKTLVFFGAIWHWHLGILRKLHTKHWFGLNLSMQLLFGIPIMKLRLRRWRRCRGLLPGGPAGDGGTPVASVKLEWPSLESRRERSSLTFFYKIHSGTVSLDKDKYLTPAPNLRHTRASHESQYTRPFAYSDALKIPFSPELFRFGIVSLLQWSYLRPLRNLRLLFKSLAQRHAF